MNTATGGNATTPGALRLAAAFLALAAAALARGGGEAPLVRVLALDGSRSVAGDAAGRERAAGLADEGLGGGDRVALLRFADGVEVARPPSSSPLGPVGLPAPAEAGPGTDIEAALRAALALIPDDARGEVLLATDGRATRGDAAAAVGEARRRGIAVRTVPLGAAGLPARAAAVQGPAVVRAGERFPLSVLVTGSPGAKGEARLEDEGAGTFESRGFAIPAGGRARLVFAVTAGGPGVRRYRASVPGPLEGAVAGAAVLVEGQAAILRLGRAAAGPGTAALLRRLGGGAFRDAAGPGAVEAALAGADLSALAAVVLDDLPERDLPPEAGERLRRAVEAGLGLCVLGGPGTLGPGGFGGRPVEEDLPVRCLPERPRPLVVLAVDCSGSMEGTAAGGPSFAAAARGAAADLARRLPSDARLALVFFHDALIEATEAFDLADPAGREAAVAAASRVRAPGGGTRFGAAAEGALGAAAKVPGPGARRLLVVTDGRPAEERAALEGIAASLRAARFSARVVAVGEDPDLARLAAFTGGGEGGGVVRAGTGELAGVLGGLASEEGRASWEPASSPVRAGPDPAPFGPAPAGLPPVEGFDRVYPRKPGRVWLAVEGGEPLLAGRQAGLGRSVVFAAAPGAGSGEWASGRAAAVLEAALRWALRAPEGEAVEASALLRPDGRIEARLETLPAATPPGEVRAGGVPLRRAGPSRWEGTVPREAAGPEGVLAFEAGGSVLARAAAAPPPSAEDLDLGPDPAALAALETPGRPLAGPRAGAGPGALAAALGALALLLAAAAGEARSSRGAPIV